MLAELGVFGVVLGHSERRELFGETDRGAGAEGAGRAGRRSAGDPLRRRDRGGARAGDTERKLRHQVQEDLARVDPERLGELVIAYEPIWAIGTGQVATAEQAQEAIAFVRALVADRSREQAQRTRILYGGGSSPTTPPSCSRYPTSTARSSAARRWTPSRLRRSSAAGRARAGRAELPGGPGRLPFPARR